MKGLLTALLILVSSVALGQERLGYESQFYIDPDRYYYEQVIEEEFFKLNYTPLLGFAKDVYTQERLYETNEGLR